MNWGSLDDFLAMGGHGLYVWGSYGIAAMLLGVETLRALRRFRRAERQALEAGEPRPAPGGGQ
jgi:heme exporter protein D